MQTVQTLADLLDDYQDWKVNLLAGTGGQRHRGSAGRGVTGSALVDQFAAARHFQDAQCASGVDVYRAALQGRELSSLDGATAQTNRGVL